MRVITVLDDVDERIQILQEGLSKAEAATGEELIEELEKFERIRQDLDCYLDELRLADPHAWHYIRAEIDEKLHSYDEIRWHLTEIRDRKPGEE
jgi:hypothetical protein